MGIGRRHSDGPVQQNECVSLSFESEAHMSTVVLIRHGRTYWNAKRKMQGQVNIPLNDEGIAQAKRAHDALASHAFEVCYSSPLDRSVTTARLVVGNDTVPIIKDERLIEHSYGVAEGSCYKHIPLYYRFITTEYGYAHHPESYRAPTGGETFDDVYRRAGSFIDEVLTPAARTYGEILISAHGGINCALLGVILGIPIERFWSVKLDNCGYAVLDADGRGSYKLTDHTPFIDGTM